MQIPVERLDQLANRLAELGARMASGTLEGEEFVKASRDYAELEPVAKIAAEVKSMREEIEGLEEMLQDPEMKAMAEEELAVIRERLPEAERKLAVAMLPRDAADARPAPGSVSPLKKSDRRARPADFIAEVQVVTAWIIKVDRFFHEA